MKKILLILIAIAGQVHSGMSQNQPIKVLEEKEVNFLFNYYEQDGNHSPVTGGIGTEKLTCSAPLTSINIPFDSIHNISVNVGLDYYTSASCDKIDRFITAASSQFISSASSADVRTHFDVDYTKSNIKHKYEVGGMLGFSNEFDVVSLSGGTHYTKTSKNDNRQLGIKASVFYDRWKLIYPGEIRNGKIYRYGNEEDDYDMDARWTTTLSFSLAQVMTKNFQFLILSDLVLQNGILNTPFHRVYFDDGWVVNDPDTNWWLIGKTMYPEKLPRSRYKIPIAVRMSYYLSDRIISRFYYRFYYDDFGITAHTISLEIPIKLSSWLTIYPLYRYYHQTASKYFAPFGVHTLDANNKPADEYYTSDYDLSGFENNKIGGGIKISPVYGLKKWKINSKTKLTFKSIELRYANYRRSDGLKANSFSFDFGFVF